MNRKSRGMPWLTGPPGLLGFTLSKGGGVNAVTLNRILITLNGQPITLKRAA